MLVGIKKVFEILKKVVIGLYFLVFSYICLFVYIYVDYNVLYCVNMINYINWYIVEYYIIFLYKYVIWYVFL